MSANAARYAPNPRRRALLAKVHIAPKQLGMTDDDYRAVLLRETGRLSAKQCTDGELEKLLAAFGRKGFTSTARRPGKPARADHPVARKARALWISLGHLCAIRQTSEQALEAFARRQLGCERLQWANQAQADSLIEALKDMGERHGWQQSSRGLAKAHYVHALWVRLCDAILVKLKRAGLAAEGWTVEDAAFRLAGIRVGPVMVTIEAQHVAEALGRHLRAHGGAGAFAEVKP